MYSLKGYLTRNLLITLTFAMVLLLYFLYQGIQILTQDFVASRLQHDADSLISALNHNPMAHGRSPQTACPMCTTGLILGIILRFKSASKLCVHAPYSTIT